MKKYFTKNNLLAAISGIFFTLPFFAKELSVLSWFCLLPLLFSIDDIRPKKAFIAGTIFGTVANYLGLYWLVGTLTRFGGFPIPISIVFILFLSIYSALQFSIFCYLVSKLKLLNKKGILNIFLIAAIWTFMEYFFPQLFPFGIGNTQAFNINIIQVVDLLGVHFLSFIIIIFNISLFKIIKSIYFQKKFLIKEAITLVLLIIALFLYGNFKIDQENLNIKNSSKISIGIVQANFDFFEKIEENEFFITEEHRRMSKEIGNVDLIIWPETAIQFWFPLDSKYLEYEERKIPPDIPNSYLLAGGLTFDPNESDNNTKIIKHNSVFLTNSDGKIIDTYNKIKLLLFGEYLPFTNYIPSIQNLSPASGDFTPGNTLNLLEIREKGVRIAPLICYEDIIPFFSREFVKKGANILINLTNDAWFGKSLAPYQHLLISIPRAVETRRYLIRSTNTGISAVIDSAGRVTSQTDIFVKTTLREEIPLLDKEITLYTKVGEIFPWLCFTFFIIIYFNSYLRRKYFR